MYNPTLANCRFIVMADSRGEDEGKNEKIFINLLDKIVEISPQPNYIFFLGDLVLESRSPKRLKARLEYFREVFKNYYSIEILLPTIGNHDVSSIVEDNTREKIFAKVFSEFRANQFLEGYNRTAYCVDIYNVRLIVLNSFHTGESNQITGRQLEWFKKVSSEPMQRKMVLLHSPAYPTGHHIDSSLDVYPKKRDQFWDIIDKNNVDLVFTGHEHNYSRRLIDKSFSTADFKFERAINQIVTGGAGGPLKGTFKDSQGVIVPPVPVHHYVIVDVYEDKLNVMAVSLAGDVIDQFTV